MTYNKLQNKTPKQLKTFLYNYGWNKSDIVDILKEDLKTYHHEEDLEIWLQFLDTAEFEAICDMFHDDIVDFIWEEMCNA